MRKKPGGSPTSTSPSQQKYHRLDRSRDPSLRCTSSSNKYQHQKCRIELPDQRFAISSPAVVTVLTS